MFSRNLPAADGSPGICRQMTDTEAAAILTSERQSRRYLSNEETATLENRNKKYSGMKMWKKIGLVLGIIFLAIGLGLLISYRWHSSSEEINRARLNQLIQNKLIVSATVAPTPYAGIYSVEGSLKAGNKPARFTITTHLDEAQVKTLLDSAEAKIDVPGKGANKGQWANIVCSLVIAALVVLMVAHQVRLGKGKGSH